MLYHRQVPLTVQNVEAMFPELISQSAAYFTNANLFKAFTAQDEKGTLLMWWISLAVKLLWSDRLL